MNTVYRFSLLALVCLMLGACGEDASYPARQAELVKITQDSLASFKEGTSAQKEAAVGQWKKALREYGAKGLEFSDWVAVVQDVKLEGNTTLSRALTKESVAVVSVKFENIILENRNLFLSENSLENSIAEGKPLYATVTSLKKGQKVLVSGRIMQDAGGGPREMSMTDSGGISSPEYLVIFTEIKLQE